MRGGRLTLSFEARCFGISGHKGDELHEKLKHYLAGVIPLLFCEQARADEVGSYPVQARRLRKVPMRRFSGAVLVLIGLYFVVRRHHSDDSPKHDDSHQRQRNVLFGFGITFLNPMLAATWSAGVAALHSVVPLRYSPPMMRYPSG